MRLRSEEHRALGDTLPSDLKAEAVRLNVASRERGGESVITQARAKELGEQGVRDVVAQSQGDPQRAARLIAEQQRLVRERSGRER